MVVWVLGDGAIHVRRSRGVNRLVGLCPKAQTKVTRVNRVSLASCSFYNRVSAI